MCLISGLMPVELIGRYWALAARIPIVAVPLAFEQPATAARLARVGAACVVSPADGGRGALEPTLRRVLTNPTYRQAARLFAMELAAGGGATEAAVMVDAALRDGEDARLVAPSLLTQETGYAAHGIDANASVGARINPVMTSAD